ncbi:uncharacterized protein BX663DRAFT_496619 [Cokeromyces recurvatus]|uniref:uncharacterized protein n=1 Tax=Cokeromyces recurvatus TaxID=90255 RepID=UPI00221F9DEE|nr:uncharacterized protein BX663DRAFT_496619 [Cokeromyces recurvatus]KAI7906480.1 hypothetical protein BX663DRAFT_496619 [Cokeromyces recurvatus]
MYNNEFMSILQQQQQQQQQQQSNVFYDNVNSDCSQQQAERSWSKKVLHEISGLIYVLSPTGKVIYCSESCIEQTGYQPYELTGKLLIDFLHVDDVSMFLNQFQNAFKSMSRIKVHYRMRCRNNTYLLLELIGQPKQDRLDQLPHSFLAIAQPYISRSDGLLGSFLEIKKENEWLKEKLNYILSLRGSSSSSPTSSAEQLGQLVLTQQQQQLQYYYSQPFMIPPLFDDNNILLTVNNVNLNSSQTLRKQSSIHASSAITTMFQTNNNNNDNDNNNNNKNTIEAIAELEDSKCQWNNDNNLYTPSMTASVSGLNEDIIIKSTQKQDKQSIENREIILPYTANPSSSSNEKALEQKGNWKRRKSKYQFEYICTDCGTTASPEWRKGPCGPKTLCNACGLRWSKKNKKKI